MTAPRNRKQRRAAAASSEESSSSFDPSSIPLALPPSLTDDSKSTRTSKKGEKTLFEIAAERQAELNQFTNNGAIKGNIGNTILNPESSTSKTQFLQISSSGEVSSFDPNKLNSGKEKAKGEKHKNGKEVSEIDDNEQDGAPLPPILDTVLLSFPLSGLHCTLAFLAAHQYAQEIHIKDLLWESAVIAFPILSFCIHLAHGHFFKLPFTGHGRKPSGSRSFASLQNASSAAGRIAAALKLAFPLRTVVFLPLAIYLGATLVQVTNESPFYAVIKRAPALGTLWVWCILEMSLGGALLGVLGPLGWGTLWKGYGIM